MLLDGGCFGKKALRDALGLTSEWHEPRWPLPNLKATDESTFWGWQTSYSPLARAHLLNQKVDGKFVDIFLFRMPDVGDFIDGGFAVVVGRHGEPDRVKYFEWRACDHDFAITESRNCYRKYTCKICGKSYDVDSS